LREIEDRPQFPHPGDALGWVQALTCQRPSMRENIIPILLGPLIGAVTVSIAGIVLIMLIPLLAGALAIAIVWIPITLIGITAMLIYAIWYYKFLDKAGRDKYDGSSNLFGLALLAFVPVLIFFLFAVGILGALFYLALGFLYLFSWIIGSIAIGIRLGLESTGRYRIDNTFNVLLTRLFHLIPLCSDIKFSFAHLATQFIDENEDDSEAMQQLVALLKAGKIPINDGKIEDWFIDVLHRYRSDSHLIEATINALPSLRSKDERKMVKQLYVALGCRLLEETGTSETQASPSAYLFLLRVLTNAPEVSVPCTKKWLKGVLKNTELNPAKYLLDRVRLKDMHEVILAIESALEYEDLPDKDKAFISYYLRSVHRDRVAQHLYDLKEARNQKRGTHASFFGYLPVESIARCANFATMGNVKRPFLNHHLEGKTFFEEVNSSDSDDDSLDFGLARGLYYKLTHIESFH